jgi:hypothetical protein
VRRRVMYKICKTIISRAPRGRDARGALIHMNISRAILSTGNFWDSDVFLHILFLDDHNFINNHPPNLKLVSNDAPCDLLQSALKIRL